MGQEGSGGGERTRLLTLPLLFLVLRFVGFPRVAAARAYRRVQGRACGDTQKNACLSSSRQGQRRLRKEHEGHHWRARALTIAPAKRHGITRTHIGAKHPQSSTTLSVPWLMETTPKDNKRTTTTSLCALSACACVSVADVRVCRSPFCLPSLKPLSFFFAVPDSLCGFVTPGGGGRAVAAERESWPAMGVDVPHSFRPLTVSSGSGKQKKKTDKKTETAESTRHGACSRHR